MKSRTPRHRTCTALAVPSLPFCPGAAAGTPPAPAADPPPAKRTVTLHFPHFGTRAEWYTAERLLKKYLRPWQTYVYYYARPTRPTPAVARGAAWDPPPGPAGAARDDRKETPMRSPREPAPRPAKVPRCVCAGAVPGPGVGADVGAIRSYMGTGEGGKTQDPSSNCPSYCCSQKSTDLGQEFRLIRGTRVPKQAVAGGYCRCFICTYRTAGVFTAP